MPKFFTSLSPLYKTLVIVLLITIPVIAVSVFMIVITVTSNNIKTETLIDNSPTPSPLITNIPTDTISPTNTITINSDQDMKSYRYIPFDIDIKYLDKNFNLTTPVQDDISCANVKNYLSKPDQCNNKVQWPSLILTNKDMTNYATLQITGPIIGGEGGDCGEVAREEAFSIILFGKTYTYKFQVRADDSYCSIHGIYIDDIKANSTWNKFYIKINSKTKTNLELLLKTIEDIQ